MIRQAEYEAEYHRFMSFNESAHIRSFLLNALEGWSEEKFNFSFSGSGDHSLSSFTEWLENIDDIENLLK